MEAEVIGDKKDDAENQPETYHRQSAVSEGFEQRSGKEYNEYGKAGSESQIFHIHSP